MNDIDKDVQVQIKLEGTYNEPFFNKEGKLIVNKSGFKIEFYFPGIDLRYNGKLIYIYESDIDKYIKAIEKNWERLCELKELSRSLKTITLNEDGLCNMHLTAQDNSAVLYIFNYDLPISNKNEIENLLLKLKSVKDRVEYIRKKVFE